MSRRRAVEQRRYVVGMVDTGDLRGQVNLCGLRVSPFVGAAGIRKDMRAGVGRAQDKKLFVRVTDC